MAPNDLNILNYPIETPEAKKFWASKHKCNKVKAIIAFSLDLDNANDNLRRYGYTLGWRKRAIAAHGKYVNNPSMTGIPFTPLSVPYWECMPIPQSTSHIKPVSVRKWIDSQNWGDTKTW